MSKRRAVLRATEGDTGVVRFVAVERDGDPVPLVAVMATAKKPGGSVTAVGVVIDDEDGGLFHLIFGSLDESGEWSVEIDVNGENIVDPVPLYVRPLYERGPR